MPTASLSSPPFPAPLASADSRLASDDALILDPVRAALARYCECPGDPQRWHDLVVCRRVAAKEIAQLARSDRDHPLIHGARGLGREISAAGIQDRTAEPDDLALASSLARRGTPGLIAAMLLAPAWQWTDAPLLAEVPAWLVPQYVGWLFQAPQGFSAPGHAETYALHLLRRLEEMVRWVKRCPGANLEAEVLGVLADQASAIPLYFSQGHLRRHAELRGWLLSRMAGERGSAAAELVASRDGRRLRVGFVNRHFGPQTETYTTLPTFEQLDPERFDVILFAHRAGDTPLERYCRERAARSVNLPADLHEQVAMLREAELDVVVFGTNVTAVCNEVTRLALHRVAPLQVVNNSSCITSGLPEVDLYVSGSLTETAGASAQFTERLGLLPGPAHAFNYDADRQEPRPGFTRADFGLPEDAVVFVSAANYFKIIPEMRHAWARLLAAVPGSRLLVHPFNPNWSSSYPIARFRSEFESVLAGHGVAASRLAVSTERFPSRSDVTSLIGLGDVYLDTFPFGGVNSLVDPLEAGLPVVAWEGETFRSRMGAALLRTLNLSELIATDADGYQMIAERLATDAVYRETICKRIRTGMERTPVFLDPLAASDAFGDLIEKAYDELAAVQRQAFRENPEPLRAAPCMPAPEAVAPVTAAEARVVLRSTPNDAAARHVLGRALLEDGRAGRAVTYLLAALQGNEDKVGLWIDLARALRADGQVQQAIQALEAGLRSDDTQLEGWLMLAELARDAGAEDLAREATAIAQELAPTEGRD
jgi:tetratricopeptide (TPR) repeat protein